MVGRTKDLVRFVALNVAEGLKVAVVAAKRFDELYRPIQGYPELKAAQAYARFATALGATPEVMTELGRVVKLSPEVIELATTRVKTVVAEDGTKTIEKVARGQKGKKPAGGTAAELFRSLIMEGKLTDDQIFAQVKQAFNLDDKKRAYVSWYRKDLVKQGKEVPPIKK